MPAGRATVATPSPPKSGSILEIRRTLEDLNKSITHAYFTSSGLASVVAKAPRGREIEVGMIGREGITGIKIVVGKTVRPTTLMCRLPDTDSALKRIIYGMRC